MRRKALSVIMLIALVGPIGMAAQESGKENWRLAPAFGHVQKGDLKALKEDIASGVNPNSIGPDGSTLLMEAVVWKRKDIAEFLIQAGANVGAEENAGIVGYACFNNDLEMVKILVEAGGIVQTKDMKSRSRAMFCPLLESVVNSNYEMMQYLLSHGANPNDAGIVGTTALHMAAAKGNVQMLSLLLSKGAEINIRDNYGQTPLMYACREGEAEAVEFLLDHGADADLEDGYGRKASHMVPHSGGNEEIRILCTGKRKKEAHASPSP